MQKKKKITLFHAKTLSSYKKKKHTHGKTLSSHQKKKNPKLSSQNPKNFFIKLTNLKNFLNHNPKNFAIKPQIFLTKPQKKSQKISETPKN